MAPAPAWRSVWITGASTGIGRELALRLAGEGATVAASARSAETLAELTRLSPGIVPYPVDVTDAPALADTHRRIEEVQGGIDLAILNAGTWRAMSTSAFDAAAIKEMVDVNFLGITNALAPILPRMIARRSGHIALTASVAGYRGMPRAAAYAASKAAVINLAETLKPDLERKGIRVSVIVPGFVDTPMTADNRFPMPFMITASDAADRIMRGLHKGKFEIAFPWRMIGPMKLARVLPYPAFFWLQRMFFDQLPMRSRPSASIKAPSQTPELTAPSRQRG